MHRAFYAEKEDLVMDSENKRLKIAFLNSLVLQDKLTSWSITNGYIAQSLQKYCGDLTYIGPILLKEALLGKILNKGTQLLFKKGFMYYHSFFLAKRFAKIADKLLTQQPYDVIVAPSCATEIAFLETNIPIILIEDANVALLHEYYAQYSHLLKRSFYEANTLEELALNKASIALYPSEWAARSARENYRVHDTQKVHMVPFGGNIDSPPPIEVVEKRKKTGKCTLFFLGTDWERKGGEIAFETLLTLEEMGIQAELIVCGCIPPSQFVHERMTVIPFLSKKDEKQRMELDRLFETSDFLILPTRGETYGMVFCEASAFGLPSITTNTGGVSGAVRDGDNGFTLPFNARGAEYAELIAKVYQDDQRYAALVRSSRAAYDERLNWDAWGTTATRLIQEMLIQNNNRPDATTSSVSTKVSGCV